MGAMKNTITFRLNSNGIQVLQYGKWYAADNAVVRNIHQQMRSWYPAQEIPESVSKHIH